MSFVHVDDADVLRSRWGGQRDGDCRVEAELREGGEDGGKDQEADTEWGATRAHEADHQVIDEAAWKLS